MLTSADVVVIDLGRPVGSEAGYLHPAVVVTAQRLLDASPSVVQVVPLTSTPRGFGSEIDITADQHNDLNRTPAPQCQHVRALTAGRLPDVRATSGDRTCTQIREVLGLILDLPVWRSSKLRPTPGMPCVRSSRTTACRRPSVECFKCAESGRASRESPPVRRSLIHIMLTRLVTNVMVRPG
jgi:mRNA-degrading endonuclease toxin of MazEF toxin-antitoxin module